MLGRFRDEEVAKRTARTLSSVEAKRESLGRKTPFPKIKPWTPAEIRLLVKYRDEVVAEKTGRGLSGVRTKRYELRIPIPGGLR